MMPLQNCRSSPSEPTEVMISTEFGVFSNAFIIEGRSSIGVLPVMVKQVHSLIFCSRYETVSSNSQKTSHLVSSLEDRVSKRLFNLASSKFFQSSRPNALKKV